MKISTIIFARGFISNCLVLAYKSQKWEHFGSMPIGAQ